MTASRPLLLDATAALAAEPDERVLEITSVLAGLSPHVGTVRVTRGGLAVVDTAVLTSRASLATVRRWLLGGPRPAATRPRRTPWATWPRHPLAPPGTVLLKPGVVGWDDPAFRAWLARHPGVSPVAMVDKPVAVDWPEYASHSALVAMRAGLAASSRTALAIVVPDESTSTWVQETLAEAGGSLIPVQVVAPPSTLAGTTAGDDHALAAISYFVVPGRIEDRANTLLLLQIWRDLIRLGETVPKLVLVGRRGDQIEEIRPLLDWNEAIAASVIETPGLEPNALRHLVVHARAVLAPAFAGQSAALLRDTRALGTPVIAATCSADGWGDGTTIDPTDGPAWRIAILAAASREVSARWNAVLPEAQAYLRQILDLLPSA